MSYSLLMKPPRILHANYYEFKKGESAGPHFSTSDVFLLCIKGKGVIRSGKKNFALAQGEVLHLQWAAPVKYIAHDHDPFLILSIHLSYQRWSDADHTITHVPCSEQELLAHAVKEPSSDFPVKNTGIIIASVDSALFEIAAKIVPFFNDQNAFERTMYLRTYALEFVLEILKSANRTAPRCFNVHADKVRMVAVWMEQNFFRPLTRKELAQRAGMGESAFAQTFRAVTTRAPIDYLVAIRLAQACRLLRSTSETINKVAQKTGFAEVSYFSRLFKKRQGVSPLKYRCHYRARPGI